MSTAVSKLPRRVAVERGIYHQGNGKYAVCFMVAGKPHFRTIGYDLGAARRERAALIEAARRGALAISPQLRFATVAGRWLARFEERVRLVSWARLNALVRVPALTFPLEGEERKIGIWLALVASLGITYGGGLATRERPTAAAPPRAARRAASSCGLVVRGVEMRVAWIRATDLAAV